MMETQRLIEALARDGARPAAPMRTSWLLALGGGSVLAALAFVLLIGPRPDIAQAAGTLRFLFKFVVTLTLLATAFQALSSLARPGASHGRAALALVAAPALLLLAVLAELVVVPATDYGTRMVGTNAAICLTFIPLIGIGPLAAFMIALRRGAPTRPALAGLVAGLVAGGLSATFYAAHCTDDSPLFVAVWYTLAIGMLALAGSLLGRWSLRW